MIEDKLIEAVEAFLIYEIGAKGRLEPAVSLNGIQKLAKLPGRGQTVLLAHDGSLTGPDMRKWGAGVPHYSCNRFMTVKFPNITGDRNRLYPAALMGITMSRSERLPIAALTLGHQRHQDGRVHLTQVIEPLGNLMLTNPREYRPVMEALWESRALPREKVRTAKVFEPWLKEWQEAGVLPLKETPGLLSEREDTGNWGTW